jgi:hypothetical protein
MLCRACQETELGETPGTDDGVSDAGDAGGDAGSDAGSDVGHEAGDDAGGLCSRCGRLRTPEDLVKRARDKHSQLEGFGLAGRRGSLLDRKRRKDKDQ